MWNVCKWACLLLQCCIKGIFYCPLIALTSSVGSAWEMKVEREVFLLLIV